MAGGSTVTPASGITGLFGSYSGLSLLNAAEVLQIIISASGGDARLSINSSAGATNDGALRIFSSASTFDLPPMVLAEASQITFAREGSNNPVLFWTILKRVPFARS